MENKTTKQIGDEAEQIAANFLISQGLKILHKNYKTRFGEIDLIAQDANATLIFVEVRFRKFDKYQKFIDKIPEIWKRFFILCINILTQKEKALKCFPCYFIF